MAISTYASYRVKTVSPSQRLQDYKASVSSVTGRMMSHWLSASDGGSAPSTAVVPTNATAGALGQRNGAGILRFGQVIISMSLGGLYIIYDRLSHQGGLSGTALGAQTTNLPTAALTRYTSGVGVVPMIEIYTAIGTAGSATANVVASYTNQAGTAGRTTGAVLFGQTSYNTAQRAFWLPLQPGDTGCRSVESVTISETSGTAGNFGVTLCKPLFFMPTFSVGGQILTYDSMLTMCGNMPQIVDNACLAYLQVANNTSTGFSLTASRIIEE